MTETLEQMIERHARDWVSIPLVESYDVSKRHHEESVAWYQSHVQSSNVDLSKLNEVHTMPDAKNTLLDQAALAILAANPNWNSFDIWERAKTFVDARPK